MIKKSYSGRPDGVEAVTMVRHDDEQRVVQLVAVRQPPEEVPEVAVRESHPRQILMAQLCQEREAKVSDTSRTILGHELAHIVHL